jgi:predicted AlkP superfamily phosphohydrolase/phosphomutase
LVRTLILGLDAYDPKIFERLSGEGRLPNLTALAESKGYAPFQVANPPQSEVSWTSIATGLNPGYHGIFDFVHRNPESYTPFLSLLVTKKDVTGTQFAPPYRTETLFDQVTRQGYPATVLWWPATFPARPERLVKTLPGLGTPDIQGRLGVGTLFSNDPALNETMGKTPVQLLTSCGDGCYDGTLPGPSRQSLKGDKKSSSVDLRLEVYDDINVTVSIGDRRLRLEVGTWSPIVEITFKLGFLVRMRALTRVVVTRITPDVRLYVMPLQIHPLRTPWRYGTPRPFVKQTWRDAGPFLTLGMPQDTTALEDGCIDDAQFLQLCDDILASRERVLMRRLNDFQEGVVAAVFDSLDRIQHMFWPTRMDVVETWYEKLDGVVGRALARATQHNQRTRVVVVSDHGIAPFRYKVHLNRWLLDQGYLVSRKPQDQGSLKDVDWSKTKAYALGLNSLYLNVRGREGQGVVSPDEVLHLVEHLKQALEAWQGPEGQVVRQAWLRSEAFQGPLTPYGPDIVVGYAPGYRGSAETGLGQWQRDALTANGDHWGADHCMDYRAVPGVLFANRDLRDVPTPSYHDFPMIAAGVQPSEQQVASPPSLDEDDEETVEERLKSLGYL